MLLALVSQIYIFFFRVTSERFLISPKCLVQGLVSDNSGKLWAGCQIFQIAGWVSPACPCTSPHRPLSLCAVNACLPPIPPAKHLSSAGLLHMLFPLAGTLFPFCFNSNSFFRHQLICYFLGQPYYMPIIYLYVTFHNYGWIIMHMQLLVYYSLPRQPVGPWGQGLTACLSWYPQCLAQRLPHRRGSVHIWQLSYPWEGQCLD